MYTYIHTLSLHYALPICAQHHLVHHPIVDGCEQLLLRSDVVVERALAQPVGVTELDDAGGVVALPGEHLRRGVDDRLTARRQLLAACGLAARRRHRHPPRPYTGPVKRPKRTAHGTERRR